MLPEEANGTGNRQHGYKTPSDPKEPNFFTISSDQWDIVCSVKEEVRI
jgi:hypothetical protein